MNDKDLILATKITPLPKDATSLTVKIEAIANDVIDSFIQFDYPEYDPIYTNRFKGKIYSLTLRGYFEKGSDKCLIKFKDRGLDFNNLYMAYTSSVDPNKLKYINPLLEEIE